MNRAQVGMLSLVKGASFEAQFAEYMREKLGFAATGLNQFLTGKACQRPHEVDIIGVKKLHAWRVVYVLAFLVILAGVITISAPRAVPHVTRTMTVAGEKVQKIAGLTSAGAGIIAIGVVAFVFGMMGDRHSRKRVWVECKNRKTRVKRDDVAKTLAAVEDVRRRVGRRRADAIDEVWFASNSGYDFDAVNMSRANGVVLYMAGTNGEGTTFDRVW